MLRQVILLLLTFSTLASIQAFPNLPPLPDITFNPPPSIPSFPATTATIACQQDCGWNTIDVSGSATLHVSPDIASLNVQVTGNGDTVADAITALSRKITLVLSTITDLGLSSSNWKTNYLNVRPNTSYVNDTLVTYGQIASQSMTITIPMANSTGTAVGALYDGLARVSDISINGLTFDLQNKTKSYINARKLAYENALQKANDYLSAAGVTLGAPVTLTDSYSSAPVATPMASPMFKTLASSSDVATTVSVGTIAINYNIDVVFSFS